MPLLTACPMPRARPFLTMPPTLLVWIEHFFQSQQEGKDVEYSPMDDLGELGLLGDERIEWFACAG